MVDTQLPHQLATALKQRGHEAVHASELPMGSQDYCQLKKLPGYANLNLLPSR